MHSQRRGRPNRVHIEAVEPRLLMAVVINEFLANNGTGLADQDGDHSDWIELHNSGPGAVNLGGWYLTDDLSDRTKWQLPSTNLAAGGYLVVFASGKNRAVAGAELHTNFALDADGEDLALVMPDGTSVVDSYAAYPAQKDDVSYGRGQVASQLPYILPGATAKTRVPTNASLDAVWNSPSYTPDGTWMTGTTGVGFVATVNGFRVRQFAANVSAGSPIGTGVDNIDEAEEVIGNPAARTSIAGGNYATVNFVNTNAGPASDSGRYTGDVQFPGHTAPTNYDNFVTESRARITIPSAGNWTFGVRSNEGFLLAIDDFELSRPNVGGATTSDLIGTFNFPAAGVYELSLVHFERTGSAYLELFAAPGSFTTWNATNFNLVGDTANGGLAVLADVITPAGNVLADLIGTNVRTQMQGVNSSLYTRLAFNVDSPGALDELTLRTKYDDAFIAYINGVEVARRNVTGATAWNKTADSARTGEAIFAYEDISISAAIPLLNAGTNVLAIQCLNVSAGDADALIMPELHATDYVVGGTSGYFTIPTPGSVNGTPLAGFVEDTTFDHDRGFYDAPFNLVISTPTAGAQIRYTTNGTPPTATTGTVYTGPIVINKTTTMRAAAFLSGYLPTNVDTQTYLFVNDVVQQTSAKTVQLGFPTTWGTSVPNTNFPASVFPDGAGYGLDPDIVGNFDVNGNSTGGDLYGGVYAAAIKDALKSIPTLSIVMNTDDLFSSSTGIITNASQRGVAWERPTSVEWITPDGAPEFQVDAGIRIQGAFFRSNSNNLKKSFRLLFKEMYGPGKLEFPLFAEGAVESFNTLVLRGGGNDGYTWNNAKLTEQYTRDQFMRGLQRASGHPSPSGNFAHLYLNGVYWGLYNPVERPDNEFAASYLGGDPDNYDVMHRGGGAFEVQSGDRTAWDAMLALAQQAVSSPSAYMELQGKNLDGTPNPATPPLIDLVSYVDYIIVSAWGANWDWPRNNFWAARDRNPATTTGFHFFNWDGENTMGNNRSRSPLTADVFNPAMLPGSQFGQDGSTAPMDNAGRVHSLLKNNAEYRQLFADRAHKFLFNDGILTPASLIPRYQAVANYVQSAMIGESARWGDMQAHRSPTPNRAITPADWTTERDWILGTYLPQRTGIVLSQWKGLYDLYPDLDAPTYSHFGGNVPNGFNLTMTVPAGTIYYTLDGSDPRLFGGGLNPAAIQYSGAITLDNSTRVQARAFDGTYWSALVDATFLTTLGYPVRMTEVHYHPAGNPSVPDQDDLEFIELLNTGTATVNLDGVQITQFAGTPYVFGNISLAAGQRIVVARDPAVFTSIYGGGINLAPAGFEPANLSNGGERIVLLGPLGETLADFTFDDVAPWPTAPDGGGPSLEIIDPLGDPANPANWQASAQAGGTPGTSGNDTTAPTILGIVFNAAGGSVTVQFSEGVTSLQAADLVIDPLLPAGSNITPNGVTFDTGTSTATFSFSPALGSGHYRASVAAASVTDIAGNPLAVGAEHEFIYVAAGGLLALPAGTRRVHQLAISATGRLDLGSSSLVIDYAAASPLGSWNGSAYTGISGFIQSGRNGGTWDGNGIVTSMSAAQSPRVFTTLASAEASFVLGLSGTDTATWNGVQIDATSVLIKYTYGGDANLDGELNGDDYFAIDSNVSVSGSSFGFINGDFNFDGEINGDDYFIIDSTYSAQGSPL